jgi:hypothetical protein
VAGAQGDRLACELSRAAFAPHDLETAQEHMPPERCVEILAELKPAFAPLPEAVVARYARHPAAATTAS